MVSSKFPLYSLFRKPSDVAVSFYRHGRNWYFKKGEISLDDHVRWVYLRKSSPKRWTATSLLKSFTFVRLSNFVFSFFSQLVSTSPRWKRPLASFWRLETKPPRLCSVSCWIFGHWKGRRRSSRARDRTSPFKFTVLSAIWLQRHHLSLWKNIPQNLTNILSNWVETR